MDSKDPEVVRLQMQHRINELVANIGRACTEAVAAERQNMAGWWGSHCEDHKYNHAKHGDCSTCQKLLREALLVDLEDTDEYRVNWRGYKIVPWESDGQN